MLNKGSWYINTAHRNCWCIDGYFECRLDNFIVHPSFFLWTSFDMNVCLKPVCFSTDLPDECNVITKKTNYGKTKKVKSKLDEIIMFLCVIMNTPGSLTSTSSCLMTPSSPPPHFLLNPTLEGPLEYIWIMFSAPCLTLSSMSFCLLRAARRLLLVHILASLFGVSGVRGHSGESWKKGVKVSASWLFGNNCWYLRLHVLLEFVTNIHWL